MGSIDGLSPPSSTGSQSLQQSTSSNTAAYEAAFAKSLAAAQIGDVDAASGKPPSRIQTASKLVLHAKFQQALAKAMADVADARNEATASED
jgi:hypothetical protein